MDNIEQAARIIREGGIVAFPTETVYGLGADALNLKALARVFEAKNRPTFDPLIVHVADLDQAQSLVTDFPASARKLAGKFWPGPLTLVLPKKDSIPDLVTASLPTVALRIPAHPLALELLRKSGRPIAAPSANPFGAVSPTTAEHVRQGLGDRVDLILDGGACAVGVESTVLSFTEKTPVLLRPGGLAVEDIEALIGPVVRPAADPDRPQAPGQLARHYAPKTTLYPKDAVPSGYGRARIGLLAFRGPVNDSLYQAVEILSESGDLGEAAANLFAALRRLDAKGLDFIAVEKAPDRGLGVAINDRLLRASRK